MNDKIRAQIARNRHHQKNANGLELLDLEYLHELFGRNADTMERLLAVYEAAVKCVHEDDSYYNVTDSMSDAIAAVEKGE